VLSGQAFAYLQYLGDCNAKEYLDAEYLDAEYWGTRSLLGVWALHCGITRPWVFRRSRSPATSGGTT
jgi:hypothetical protein